ncbi:hypothetical protein BACIH_1729 [Bacillus amyloliquefaciens]|nr:hypothetical protein U471_17500 [Bacillus amyloliquefaciens CC178]QEY93469.1 hypothetical protein BACIH_1729 [Bacillus amyloliquefaciens]
MKELGTLQNRLSEKKINARQCISKKIGNKYGVDKRRNHNGTYKHRIV